VTGSIDRRAEKRTNLVFSFAPYILLFLSRKSLPTFLKITTKSIRSNRRFKFIITNIAILEYHGKLLFTR
jgi:hypothetical protein